MQGTITLRKLINSNLNINVWKKSANGEFVPTANESGFNLFDNINKYPLFFDGTYYIGGMQIIPKIDNVQYIDNEYRNMLNNKIINHYLMYSIGSETPWEFLYIFNTLLTEFMPTANAQYRQLWEYFAQKLPYSYFEHNALNGGNTQTYNNLTDKINNGDVKNYEWGGNLAGQNINDPDTNINYEFDTPQNINSLNPESPDHMSSANSGKSHSGERFSINGVVHLENGVPGVYVDDDHPTNKTTYGETNSIRTGSITDMYNNRYDEKYGYNINDIKIISESYNEFCNVDMKIINALRDAFLYVY